MLPERWQGCILLLMFLLSNASASETIHLISPSDLAQIIQSKQIRHARLCNADHQLLKSLANTEVEVMLTIANEELEPIAELQEEANAWISANVLSYLAATKITYIMAGNDVLTTAPGNALLLVPAMRNLHSALAATRLDDRVKVSSPVSIKLISGATFTPELSPIMEHFLRFLKETGSPFFLKGKEGVSDVTVEAAYNAILALNFSGIPVIATESEGLNSGDTLVYHSYMYDRSNEDKRRVLATGSQTGLFCVALQNADPAALQAGLNWACGPGHADCSAIQPGAPCYKQNNLVALASYAYNDYYHKMASTGATCSFNGTATTTPNDPSSGQCIFAGSTMAGGSNASITPSASPPGGFSPPTGVSPPTGFGPPTGFSPPSFNGTPSGTFGGSPSSTLGPLSYGSSVSPRAHRVLCLLLLLPLFFV